MTSSTKAARARRAKHAPPQRAPAAEDATGKSASPLEESLRALNAKLIARLRASEAVAADAVAARTVAQQALQTAQRGRKSIDGSLEQLSAHRDALELERDQLKLECERLLASVDQLTGRVAGVSGELGDARAECDRLRQLHESAGEHCEALEKQVVETKDKLDAERMVISSLERQLDHYAVTAAKRGAASMSPQSYSSIDTGDTLRSDTCVSAAGASHTAIRVHDECDSAVAHEDTNALVHESKSVGFAARAFEAVASFFEGVWRWGADLATKLLSLVGVRRGAPAEGAPLLRA
ncbi:FYVE and coiled-coil domain containing protein [Gracilaria domingensis]|nr:FYVE and coiled-coil domain containing protein [Gracilaria domingensis]